MNDLTELSGPQGGHILLLALVSIFTTMLPTVSWSQSSQGDLLSPATLPLIRDDRVYQVSSYDTTGGNHDYITIPAGDTATLMDVDGPGIVTRMWMTVGSSDPYYLRRIVILMYWDDESSPSVEVPLGDFFGTGFEYKEYTSRFVGMSSGGFYCYFPMPFNKSARIEIVNQTGRQIDSYYYNFDYRKLNKPLDSDVGYFHAWWNRNIRTTSHDNYVILDTEGEGQFVGVNLNIQGYDHDLWFLEGDEMIYVDGEETPSIHGTGTEDFFNSGWYFDKGEFSAEYHGLILKSDSLSRIAAYRFFVGDAVPFKKSIRVTIEHGTENTEIADYSSTAYWYQVGPQKEHPPMLPASLRIPLRVAVPNGATEAESLIPVQTSLNYSVEDMSSFGPDWSGSKQLKVVGNQKGDSFVLPVPVKAGDTYSVVLYYTKGPDYANVGIMENGKKVGQIDGYSASIIPGGSLKLMHLSSVGDSIPLQFVILDKDPSSRGYSVGLDAFVAEPERHFVNEWEVIGPFPNPVGFTGHRYGLDRVYPPEMAVDMKGTYKGLGGQDVNWRAMKIDAKGYLNLSGKFNPDQDVVAYAAIFVWSPRDQEVPFLFGSDDGVKVLLNGKEIYRKLVVRGAVPDDDRVSLSLKTGWNVLLMKIENNTGGYGFYSRLLDKGKGIKYSLQNQE